VNVNTSYEDDTFGSVGAGRKCEHEGCIKLALGRTVFCSVHGGGKRCEHEGCGMLADGVYVN
jgi:hypothetical protein